MGSLRRHVGPEAWRHEVVPCACRREELGRRVYERIRAASCLTERMLAYTFAGFRVSAETRGAYDLARAFAARPDGWLVLWGPPGRGKTHLLAAVANELLAAGGRALYVMVPDLLDHLRAGVGAGDLDRRMEAAREVDVLLLDDLGAEQETEWAREQVFKLLNWRYTTWAPTVVATNLAVEDLPARVGSRLRDRALSQVIFVGGADYRKSEARAAEGSMAAARVPEGVRGGA